MAGEGGSSAIRAGRAFVELFANDAALQKGLAAAEQKLRIWGRKMKRLGTEFILAGAGQLAIGLSGLFKFIEQGNALQQLASNTATTAESMSELTYALGTVGGSITDVETAFQSMNHLIMEASNGGDAASQTLMRLGFTWQQLNAMAPEERIRALTTALSQIPGEALRAQHASEVFGGAAGRMAQIIREGGSAFDRLAAEGRRSGAIMSNEDAAAAADLSKQFNALKMSLAAVAIQIGSALAPIFKDLVGWLREVIPQVVDFIKVNKELIVWVIKVSAALVATGIALHVLGHAFTVAHFGVSGLIVAVKLLHVALLLLTSPVGLIVVGLIAATAAIVYFSGAWDALLPMIASDTETMRGQVERAWTGMANAFRSGNIQQALAFAWIGIRIVFQTGVAYLMRILEDLYDAGYDIFIRLSSGMAIWATRAWFGLRAIWTAGVFFIESAWTTLWNGLAQTIVTALNGVLETIREMVRSIVYTVALAIYRLNPLTTLANDQARARARAAEVAGALPGNIAAPQQLAGPAPLANQMAALQAQLAERERIIGQERDRLISENRTRSLDNQNERAAGLQALADELARLERAPRRPAFGTEPTYQKQRAIAAADLQGDRQQIGSQGTFSGAQAAAWAGSGGYLYRAAAATERTADNTDALLRALPDLVFGA